ncbi:MAG: YraN family protein [Anaerolineales bacterium]|nr:MAG: YraN family protein [Anaerolineales bacterium]
MKSTRLRTLGKHGESIAAEYLKNKGYTILETNWHSSYGEIDLVASQAGVITFIEVKTRASKSFGPPEVSITPRKLEHMRNSAEYYMAEHPGITNEWRIDAIAIQLQTGNLPPLIEHFENVVS